MRSLGMALTASVPHGIHCWHDAMQALGPRGYVHREALSPAPPAPHACRFQRPQLRQLRVVLLTSSWSSCAGPGPRGQQCHQVGLLLLASDVAAPRALAGLAGGLSTLLLEHVGHFAPIGHDVGHGSHDRWSYRPRSCRRKQLGANLHGVAHTYQETGVTFRLLPC